MATQTSHISPAASTALSIALARIAELETQNERLSRQVEFYENQPSQMDPGFYIIDMRGEWSGPCRTLAEAQSSIPDYEEGCTIVQVVGQYDARDEMDDFELHGMPLIQSLGFVENW